MTKKKTAAPEQQQPQGIEITPLEALHMVNQLTEENNELNHIRRVLRAKLAAAEQQIAAQAAGLEAAAKEIEKLKKAA